MKSGRVFELLDALETMAKDKQQIPPRAMILSRKYRTLVSSWIEPLQEEAELGHEIDYIARFKSVKLYYHIRELICMIPIPFMCFYLIILLFCSIGLYFVLCLFVTPSLVL